MTVELTVCGSAGSHTGPGRACSGYLLRSGDTALMLDCGNGASANLQTAMPFPDLDAVVVSHAHADHCADLVGMSYLLRFAEGGPGCVTLHAAPGVVDRLAGLMSEDGAAAFRTVFPGRGVDVGDTVQVGPFRIDFHRAAHPVPTLSMRIQVGDLVIAYSADSGGSPELVDCARGADLFLCEATWQGDPDQWPEDVHLTARAAGATATRADVGTLLLTHVQGGSDLDRSLAEARETFAGEVALAHDNHTWRLP